MYWSRIFIAAYLVAFLNMMNALFIPAFAADCDVAILNGRVMDPETRFDGVRNVCVKGNRIAKITEARISGKDTIDAKGHVVAPGFIDTHIHAMDLYAQKLTVRDGVTTIMDFEGGVASITLFYSKYKGASLLNYAAGIGHEPIRQHVMDSVDLKNVSDPPGLLAARTAAEKDGHASWALDVPNEKQRAKIMEMMEEGLKQGAVAVTSTVGYMGFGTPTLEIFDLQKLAKKYERVYGSHTRYGPNESLPNDYSLGVREALANAAALDGAMLVLHIQWRTWPEIYELCTLFQKQGKNIWCEYYPYISGNPNIGTPQLVKERLKENNVVIEKMIMDPVTAKFFTEEEFFRAQKENPGKPVFIFFGKADMKNWIKMKNVQIASDAVPYLRKDGTFAPISAPYKEFQGHPRIAGTRGFIFRVSREEGIPLMDTLTNTGYITAKMLSRLGLKDMQERGRMQEGMIADITIFNPETIRENSTYKIGEQGLPTTGIPYVLVNGHFVVRDSKVDIKVRPGQPIRYPVKK